MAQKTYDYAELTLEDFEASGMPMCILSVGAEFSIVDGWPPRDFDPGEQGELQVELVTVLEAWMGPGRIEAGPCELEIIQKALSADPEALARVEEMRWISWFHRSRDEQSIPYAPAHRIDDTGGQCFR